MGCSRQRSRLLLALANYSTVMEADRNFNDNTSHREFSPNLTEYP
jgi:hypothetical protein